MRRKLFSHIDRCPALALLILIFCAAAPLVAADPPRSAQLDAHRIMEAVNAKYTSFMNEPREVQIHHTVLVTGLGQPDIELEETDLAYLQGDKARVETLSSTVNVASPGKDRSAAQPPDQRRRVWVHDGKETRVLFESGLISTDGSPKSVTQAFRIRHDQIPADLPQKIRTPLRSNEFDAVFLNAKFQAYPTVYRGRYVYVLQSLEPIVANDNGLILNCQFWIDAQDMLLLRMEMAIQQKTPEQREPVYLTAVLDMVTTFGVSIDPAKFTLDLPRDAEDLTPTVVKAAAQLKKP